jgi:copper transport protein
MRRLLLAVGVVAIAVAGWAAPAFGHAVLQSTDPPSGAVLSKSPGSVVLHFGEDVEVQFGSLRVFDARSRRVDTGNAYHPHGDGHAVAVDVPANLPSGGYVVTWRVVSADSHPVHGAFTFQIGAGGAGAAEASKAQATKLLAATGGSRTVGALFGVVRFLAFIALFVLVGGVAFVTGAWPAGARDRRTRRLLWGALIAATVLTALAIGIQGPYAGGLALTQMVKPSVVSSVLHTRFGEVYLARLAVLVLAAGPLLRRLLRPESLPRWWPPAAGVCGAAILVTPGLAGHAGSGSLIALAIPFDVVHLAGAAVWIGGLAVLAAAALPRRGHQEPQGDDSMRAVVRRFSQWALVAVLAIAVSGGFAAWRQVGSLSAVTSTTFGRLLLAKTIIFAVLVSVATTSRRIAHGDLAVPFGLGGSRGKRPRPARPATALSHGPGAMAAKPVRRQPDGDSIIRRHRRRGPHRSWGSRLRQAVVGELVLAAGIIAVTASLVNAQPARSAVALPYSTEVHAGPQVLVDLVIDPAKAGPVAVHFYTLGIDGSQLDVPEIRASFSLPSAGISGLNVPLQKAGPGHFVASSFVIPLKGTWTLQMTVRTTSIDEFNADPVTVHIR